MRFIKFALVTLTLAMFVFAAACGKKDDKKKGDTPAAAGKADPKKADEKKPDEKKAPDAPKAAPAGDLTEAQLGAAMIALFEGMTAAAKKNADNCDGMAAELTKIIEGAKPLMVQAEVMEKKDPDSKKRFDKEHGPKVEKILEEMMGAIAKCEKHDGVMKALDGLE